MKSKIVSFFLIIIIILIIVGLSAIGLDLFGIINLPDQISLKTYLPNTIQVVGLNEEQEIYYPDYEATGVKDLIETRDNSTISNVNNEDRTDLSSFIKDEDNNLSNIPDSTEIINNIKDNSFYYNQLDTYGKTIYSRLYANLDELKNGDHEIDFGVTFNELLQKEEGEKILTDAFQLAINALLLDHPEIFYLDVTKMYMFTESISNIKGTIYKIKIGPDAGVSYLADGFKSKSEVLVAEQELNTILYSIKNSLNGNVYDQIKQAHDILVDNVTYDSNTTSELSHNIYGTLIKRLGVCDGYAKAYKYILDNIGISCVEVCGIAQNSSGTTESHAWNDVLIDGKWYAIDVTWDDPIIVGGNGVLTNDLKYNYFLKGADTFYSSHQEDGYIVENGKFAYPKINPTAY